MLPKRFVHGINRKILRALPGNLSLKTSVLVGLIIKRSGEQLGGRPPLPFFENQNKFPDFQNKGPDCVDPLS